MAVFQGSLVLIFAPVLGISLSVGQILLIIALILGVSLIGIRVFGGPLSRMRGYGDDADSIREFASDFIAKPFDLEKFFTTLLFWLDLRATGRVSRERNTP